MLEAALDKNHPGQALAGCRVLLTGHTGFKGDWLALGLRRLGAATTATGNIPRQPAMANVEARDTAKGYPHADEVMLGNILLACHHGLNEAQIDPFHACVGAFVDQLPTS